MAINGKFVQMMVYFTTCAETGQSVTIWYVVGGKLKK